MAAALSFQGLFVLSAENVLAGAVQFAGFAVEGDLAHVFDLEDLVLAPDFDGDLVRCDLHDLAAGRHVLFGIDSVDRAGRRSSHDDCQNSPTDARQPDVVTSGGTLE